MVFIMGFNIAERLLVKAALEKFYGIGPQISPKILAKFSIHQQCKVGSLPTPKVNALTEELMKMNIENDLKRKLRDNIRRLRDIGTYRGRRHALGLPCRGQNTRSQIQTARKLNRVERRA